MKHFILTLMALTLATTLPAQNRNVREQVAANIEMARGHYYINPNIPGEQTKAPKGYKAFYISHFARHGARYCWEDIYTRLDTLLQKAYDTNHLTAKGTALYKSLHAAMPELGWHTGELTPKGWAQHQKAANNMVKLYPEVFKKGAQVSATSSDVDRCEMSMASYCNELVRNFPNLPLYQYVSRADYDAVLPPSSSNPQRIASQRTETPWKEGINAGLDVDQVLSQYFNDLDYVDANLMKKSRLLGDIYTLWCCLQCAEEDIDMDNPFTPEQELANWIQGNLGSFNNYYSARYQSWSVLGDIVDKAEKRFASGSTGADLRFSHDSHFGPLICLLNAGGNGTIAPTKEEQMYYFQDYNICMATNFHFVFYRSNKNPEILFKLLLNSHETTLPLEPVEGPYYRWSDFKQLVERLGNEARALVAKN